MSQITENVLNHNRKFNFDITFLLKGMAEGFVKPLTLIFSKICIIWYITICMEGGKDHPNIQKKKKKKKKKRK